MAANNELVKRTEDYVIRAFKGKEGNLSIAHDFKHVDRVRNWALVIAREENYPETTIVEVTALLHDIGLTSIVDGNEKEVHVILPPHGPPGADIAMEFLKTNSNLRPDEIEWITYVIRHHSVPPLVAEECLASLGKKRKLMEIIRDADNLDALGAVGLMRAFTSKYFLPEYNPENIKGENWDLSPAEFVKKFGFKPENGLAPVHSIIDQINQQIGYYHNLHTRSAKKLGVPLVEYMKSFVIRLENEIRLS